MAHHSLNSGFIKSGGVNLSIILMRAHNALWSGVYAQRGRLFLWAPVVLAFGIGVYFYLPFEPAIWVGLIGFSLCLLLAWQVLRGKRDEEVRARWWVLVMIPVLFFAGFMLAQMRTYMVHTEFLEKKTRGGDIVGRVEAVEYLPGGKAARLTLTNVELEGVEYAPRKVRLKVHDSGEVSIGARVKLRGVLNPPPEPVIPGGFDFARHMYFKGIGAVGYAFYTLEILNEPEVAAWGQLMQRMRLFITDRIFDILPERQAAIAAALITGHKSGITSGDRDAMRASGLAHLLAISGLHIGLVCGILFFVSRLFMLSVERFALEHPVKKYAAVIALIGTVFYMFIAGATIPTQRALLMTGVVLMAILFDRMAISLRLVAFAALVVLVIAPESLLSVSFQLSFAAVTVLVAFYEGTRSWFTQLSGDGGWLRRLGLYVAGVGLTSVLATLATMPFVLYHFQQVASYGVLGNLVAVPVMAFWVMPMGLLALLLMPFGLDTIPFQAMGAGIEVVVSVALWVESLPGSIFYVSALPFSGFVLCVIGGVFIAFIKGWFRILGLFPIVLAVFLSMNMSLPFMLVSKDFDLVAVRSGDGYAVNSKRGQVFTQENWARYLGQQENGFGLLSDHHDGGLGCDHSACRLVVEGYRISYVKDFYAQSAECEWADILIAEKGLEPKLCIAKFVFDRWDGWHQGGFAFYHSSEGLRYETVQGSRGERPWVLRRD